MPNSSNMPTENSGTPAVVVEHISKTYEPFPTWLRLMLRSQSREPVTALVDVSFHLASGRICAIVGPNGAGKTTLFRILMGITSPSSGSLSVLGMDGRKPSQKIRRQIGFMPADDRSLALRLTSRENLAFHGRLRGFSERDLKKRIEEVLEQVGLAHAADRAGFALSSGMRARLQLARAILHFPRVLILDEPTASVDPISAHAFIGLLNKLATEHGMAILMSSHRLEEIETLHDNVVLLDRGRLLYWGNLDALRAHWEHPSVQIVFANERARTAAGRHLRRAGAELIVEEPLTLTVRTKDPLGRILGKLNGQLSSVVSIQEIKMPLRELLTTVVREGTGAEGLGGAR